MISLKNLCKSYDNGKTYALTDLSLQIDNNELLAIVGVSGSGKSTLLHILGGMDTASSGEYYYEDILVSGMSRKELNMFRKKHISFVFQNYALLQKHTVYQNVEIPLIARKIKNRKEIVMHCLEKTGIQHLADKYPFQLSGGEKQRTGISRALAADTDLILADEPTGALDTKTSTEIMELFTALNKQGKTIIVVTHDTTIANECGRIIRIRDGAIMA